jgi:hypothetical protein
LQNPRNKSTLLGMSQAKLQYNEGRTQFEATTPEGVEFGPIDFPEDCISFLEGEGDQPSYVVIHEGFDGLEPDTMYQLAAIDTTVEDGVVLEVEVEAGDTDAA